MHGGGKQGSVGGQIGTSDGESEQLCDIVIILSKKSNKYIILHRMALL